MEKVSQNGTSSRTAWSRVQSPGGHRSSVEGAIRAHRQRVSERNFRTEERMMASLQETAPRAMASTEVGLSQAQVPSLDENLVLSLPIEPQTVEANLARPQSRFQPRMIDDLYGEAQMGSVTERALGVVTKEMGAPEEQTSDEVPKGTYVDYTV